MRHDSTEPSAGEGAKAPSVLDPQPETTSGFFADRAEAGALLIEKLRPLISGPWVVAAVPRGGIAVALPIVEQLRLPLAVVYAGKLTAPSAPELVFGALDEDGEMIIDRAIAARLGLQAGDIERARTRVAAEIKRRMALYRVPPIAHYLPGAAVVLVDDGLATGLTMSAGLAYARRHGAREVTIAVPCASLAAARRFRREADHFVSLVVDPDFDAVGAYYADFSPVSDDAVLAALERARRAAPVSAPAADENGRRLSMRNA